MICFELICDIPSVEAMLLFCDELVACMMRLSFVCDERVILCLQGYVPCEHCKGTGYRASWLSP